MADFLAPVEGPKKQDYIFGFSGTEQLKDEFLIYLQTGVPLDVVFIYPEYFQSEIKYEDIDSSLFLRLQSMYDDLKVIHEIADEALTGKIGHQGTATMEWYLSQMDNIIAGHSEFYTMAKFLFWFLRKEGLPNWAHDWIIEGLCARNICQAVLEKLADQS